MSDMQRVRDAIEAAGLQSTSDGSGPMYNDKRANGQRRIKLQEAGFLAVIPLHMQWLIHDYLKFFFGERLVKMYLTKHEDAWYPQHRFSLNVVLRDK